MAARGIALLLVCSTSAAGGAAVRRCASAPRALARAAAFAVGSAGPARTAGAAEYTAVLLVPTGIGAAIGGYAGDALPVARALAAVVDVLVTHPNVLNGAMLYWPPPNALYVEGWALDEFAAGRLGLRRVRRNRLGLVLDAAIEPELRARHVQAADAARATLGLDIAGWALTDGPVGVELATSARTGASWGTVRRPDALVRAARALVDEHGCTALALVCRLPDSEPDSAGSLAYRAGDGVDAVSAARARGRAGRCARSGAGVERRRDAGLRAAGPARRRHQPLATGSAPSAPCALWPRAAPRCTPRPRAALPVARRSVPC